MDISVKLILFSHSLFHKKMAYCLLNLRHTDIRPNLRENAYALLDIHKKPKTTDPF